ncbi:MAG TPA: response regulator [Chloroflexota bacterium]
MDAHILVVEDNPDVRATVQWVLEDDGWPVESAADGPAALQSAKQRKPSLVVLDIRLPGINGEEVATRLRGLYNGIPILVISSDGRAAEHAQATGAYAYLSKPFELEELRRAVLQGIESGRDSSSSGEGKRAR